MMEITDGVPEWAMHRVQMLSGEQWDWRTACAHPMSLAFARYIAEHGHPPVDPVTAKVNNLAADLNQRHKAEAQIEGQRCAIAWHWAGKGIEDFRAELAKRGLRITDIPS